MTVNRTLPRWQTLLAENPKTSKPSLNKLFLSVINKGYYSIGHKLFAIDGCKVPSDAGKTWSGTFKELSDKRDKLKRMIQYQIKQHQIIIDTQAFGEGQEYHVLQPVLETIQERYQRLNIHHNLYESGIQVTADTGYANESNMKYLHEHNINAYIPDNQFRSRDPKFINQKKKYGQHPSQTKKKSPQLYSPKAFTLNKKTKQCTCPAGNNEQSA